MSRFVLLPGLRTRVRLSCCFLALGLAGSPLSSQPLAVDPAFTPHLVDELADAGHARLWPLADGSYLAAGAFTYAGTIPADGLARLAADGAPDPTFSFAGELSLSFFSAVDEGIIPLNDGRVLLYTRTQDPGSGIWGTRIDALLASGAPDPTFTAITIPGGYVLQAVPAPDGGIFLAGLIPQINDTACEGVARITPDGRADTGFILPMNGPTSVVSSLVVGLDGSVTASGYTTAPASGPVFVRRYHANGAPDTVFAPVLTQAPGALAPRLLAIQPNGRILVAGTPAIRWNPDGTVDASFNPELLPDSKITRVVPYDDGRLLVEYEMPPPPSSPVAVGATSVRLLEADGGFLTEYRGLLGETGALQIHGATATGDVLLRGADFVIISGTSTTPGGTVIVPPRIEYRYPRFTPLAADGTLAPTFRPSLGVAGTVARLAAHDTDGILMSGSFSLIDGAPARGLVRFHADGTRDLDFNPPTTLAASPPIGPTVTNQVLRYHLETVQADGRLLVSVQSRGATASVPRTVRLMPDGTWDPSFVLDPTLNVALARILDVGPDGRMVAMLFLIDSGPTPPTITDQLSLLAAGGTLVAHLPTVFSREPGAGPAASTASLVSEAQLQPDGSIMVAGLFNHVDGQPRPGIARLDAAGALDETYVPAEPFELSFADPHLISGGRAWVNLRRATPAWTPVGSARLLADGTFDPGFRLPPEVFLRTPREQADGSLLDTGSELRRFFVDGARDLNVAIPFSRAGGLPANVREAIRLADGTLYAGGQFSTVDGVPRGGLARLVPSPVPGITVQPVPQITVAGDRAFLQVAVGDSGTASVQWQHDGMDVPDATSPLLVTDRIRSEDAGSYRAVITVGSAVYFSEAVTITVNASTARLINFSARSVLQPEGPPQIAGFITTGSPAQPVLLRAIGPSLALFGLNEPFLRNPDFRLFAGSAPLADGVSAWEPSVLVRSQQVNAFSLIPSDVPPHYTEFGIAADLPAGTYTAQTVATPGTGGLSLSEFYDASPVDATGRVLNVSLRGLTAPGADTMIGGFIITGNGPLTLLLRVIGPELADWDVPDVLADPRLTLFDGATELGSNDDWNGPTNSTPAAVFDAIASTGAFPLEPDSKSAAVVVTLDPGTYTVHAPGAGDSAGEVLLEIYVVDP